MSVHCCPEIPQQRDIHYRRILWAALVINAAMFLIEIVAGVAAGSASLQANALDFLADSANYAISLFVVGMSLSYENPPSKPGYGFLSPICFAIELSNILPGRSLSRVQFLKRCGMTAKRTFGFAVLRAERTLRPN
jgi:hypothetical protein